jgi:hypothetical protein
MATVVQQIPRTALERWQVSKMVQEVWLFIGTSHTDCLMRSFKAGDEIITMDDLYGGTSDVYSNIQPFRHQVSLR